MTAADGEPDEATLGVISNARRLGEPDGRCRIGVTDFTIDTPDPFDFVGTVRSHGWVSLAPNIWDVDHETLQRPVRLKSGRTVLVTMSVARSNQSGGVRVTVRHCGRLAPDERQDTTAAAAWMLRLDEDFSAFYALCRRKGGRWTRLTSGLGRLLRSPTLFEDVVRTILTTNIQWGGTVRMVSALVDAFGEPFPGDAGLRAFPTPRAVAGLHLKAFTEAVRLGYRGPYIHELSLRIASGDLDLEALRQPGIPPNELRRRLLDIKGVGNYAAATLLMIMGHYGDLAVDTEFRQFVSQVYFDGRRVPDTEAAAIYDEWGEWKYLAYWFDLLQG